MSGPRNALGAATAGDGLIDAVGGNVENGVSGYLWLDRVEAYNPSTDSWTARRSLTVPRHAPGVVAANGGNIYAIGGYDGTARLGSVEEYDLTANTWATRRNMPTARDLMAIATAPSGKVYALGGRSSASMAVTIVEEYDPVTDTWATKANMPAARSSATAVAAANGRIYVMGGGNGTYLDRVEEYDPLTDTWTPRETMLTPRMTAASVLGPNGKLYLIGGVSTPGTIGTVEEAAFASTVTPTSTLTPTGTPTVTPTVTSSSPSGWVAQTSGVTSYLNGVSAVNATTAWVVGGDGTILKTIDGGTIWTQQSFPVGVFQGSHTFQSVAAANASVAWIIGDCGAALKTTNGGATWNIVPGVGCSHLNQVAPVDTTTAWTDGAGGTILKTTNGGASWVPQTSGTTGSLGQIDVVDANTVWIIGLPGSGGLLKTTDSGATWSLQPSGLTAGLVGISAIDAATAWAVGEGGLILKTTSGGLPPTAMPTPTPPSTLTPTGTSTPTLTPTTTMTPGAPPSNDDWANAGDITLPTNLTGTSLGASAQMNEPSVCDGQMVGRTVWFRVVPATSGTLRADTVGFAFDTTLALYQGSTLVSLNELACNNDGQTGVLTSALAANVTTGTTYYLQLGGMLGVGVGSPGVSFNNARVTLTSPVGGPVDRTTGFTYTPPARTTAVSFTIQRVVPDGSATISPVHLVDGCGTP